MSRGAVLGLGAVGLLAAASIASRPRRRGAGNRQERRPIGPPTLAFVEVRDDEDADSYLDFWRYHQLRSRDNEDLASEYQVYDDYPTAAEMRDQHNEMDVDGETKSVMGAVLEPVELVRSTLLPPRTRDGAEYNAAVIHHLEAVDEWVNVEGPALFGQPYKLFHVRMLDPRDAFSLDGQLIQEFALEELRSLSSIWNLPGMTSQRFAQRSIEVATVLYRVTRRFDAEDPPAEILELIYELGDRVLPRRYLGSRRGLGGRATFTIGDRGATPEENRRLTALFGDPRKLPGMLP